MKVLIVQNKVYQRFEKTLQALRLQLTTTSMKGVDFLVFPEMFVVPYDLKRMRSFSKTEMNQAYTFLQNLAKEYHCYVIGGSMPFLDQSNIYNRSFIFNRLGEEILYYDKQYLFEVMYPNGDIFSEKDVLTSGNQYGIFETEFGRMGVMICFDIRFPELANEYVKQGVKTIFLPAAFNTFTGPLHWKTTMKARAIDNQVFMIVSSPSADSEGSYKVYGHSMITSPYGHVIKQLDKAPGFIDCNLDLEEIDRIRNEIPILKNKKG